MGFLTDIEAVTRVQRVDPPKSDFCRPHRYQRSGKRAFDLAVTFILAPIWFPLVCILGCAIWMSGVSPFFVQPRLGRDGQQFGLLKLRTMRPGAEADLEFYLQENPVLAREWSVSQKLREDPRVTRIGRFLRATSLDELPQFFNVLMGDMSVVGPRPMLVRQRHMYAERSYYRMRPGLTGLWQVRRKGVGVFKDRARFDAIYDVTQGVWSDLEILVRTVAVILRRSGY